MCLRARLTFIDFVFFFQSESHQYSSNQVLLIAEWIFNIYA